MWYPSTVLVAPAIEPVSLAEGKEQCGMLAAETHFDTTITRMIKAARRHAEDYCNARWAEQTVVSQCDDFADLARLPEGPLKSVVSIAYVDVAGSTQSVDPEIFEVHMDGLEPAITLAHGQAWPRVRLGSRITLTAVFGGPVPESVHHAILMLVVHWFRNREAVITGTIATSIPIGVDALLSNHRRGV